MNRDIVSAHAQYVHDRQPAVNFRDSNIVRTCRESYTTSSEVNDVVSLTRRLQVVTLARRREPAVDDVTEVHVFSR